MWETQSCYLQVIFLQFCYQMIHQKRLCSFDASLYQFPLPGVILSRIICGKKISVFTLLLTLRQVNYRLVLTMISKSSHKNRTVCNLPFSELGNCIPHVGFQDQNCLAIWEEWPQPACGLKGSQKIMGETSFFPALSIMFSLRILQCDFTSLTTNVGEKPMHSVSSFILLPFLSLRGIFFNSLFFLHR